ncbi:MAG: hypothetical protein IPJ27_06505 [Candidatus Accumulibacter sp.]|uniref:Uncharacterized protein n=1 Tax=Candidatus Accumulibacter proximus TaxID=2954385 RepID=A0A935UFA8_9PROT|nr:hypothetical protein [Candidatus Accumulibacter proximus]
MIIHNDVKESWSNRSGHRYFKITSAGVREGYQPLSGTMAQQIRSAPGDSALYRYIQTNLGFTITAVLEKHVLPKQQSREQTTEIESKSKRAVDYFVSQLPEATGLPPERLVLVFDSDRARIYNPKAGPRVTVDSITVQDYLRERARAAGFAVIDTELSFSEHYNRNRQRFDFLGFSPFRVEWGGNGRREGRANG